MRIKTAIDRIVQKNRLFAKVAGPLTGTTSDRQKARIVNVLFPECTCSERNPNRHGHCRKHG